MEKTTKLEIIRKTPSRFTWGEIVKICDIGRYTIIEAKKDKSLKPRRGETAPKEEERSFHCYVDGECLGRSVDTLEGALVLCMAFGLLGSSQATDYMAQAALKLLTP